jgi:hypothetical protein
VTHAAARRFVEPGGFKEHETEAARRALTELLIDARQAPTGGTWRTRKRSTKLDISAVVEPEGRLLVVTYIDAQPYDPPSRTSAARRGTRSRFPKDEQGGSTPSRSGGSAHASGQRAPRGRTRTT